MGVYIGYRKFYFVFLVKLFVMKIVCFIDFDVLKIKVILGVLDKRKINRMLLECFKYFVYGLRIIYVLSIFLWRYFIKILLSNSKNGMKYILFWVIEV